MDQQSLGVHLDRRLTWKKHIKAKRQHLNQKSLKMTWLLGRKSATTLENKVRLYKAYSFMVLPATKILRFYNATNQKY